MNNMLFLVRLLVYALTNPKIGQQILQAKYQSWQDSKQPKFNYMNNQSSLDEILKSLFSDEFYSIEDLRLATEKLQNHTNNFFNNNNTLVFSCCNSKNYFSK